MCGRKVPKFKTFTTYRGFKITDPAILKKVDKKNVHTSQRKQYVCPKCARFHGIVQKGKSKTRKKTKKI